MIICEICVKPANLNHSPSHYMHKTFVVIGVHSNILLKNSSLEEQRKYSKT